MTRHHSGANSYTISHVAVMRKTLALVGQRSVPGRHGAHGSAYDRCRNDPSQVMLKIINRPNLPKCPHSLGRFWYDVRLAAAVVCRQPGCPGDSTGTPRSDQEDRRSVAAIPSWMPLPRQLMLALPARVSAPGARAEAPAGQVCLHRCLARHACRTPQHPGGLRAGWRTPLVASGSRCQAPPKYEV